MHFWNTEQAWWKATWIDQSTVTKPEDVLIPSKKEGCFPEISTLLLYITYRSRCLVRSLDRPKLQVQNALHDCLNWICCIDAGSNAQKNV